MIYKAELRGHEVTGFPIHIGLLKPENIHASSQEGQLHTQSEDLAHDIAFLRQWKAAGEQREQGGHKANSLVMFTLTIDRAGDHG